MTNKEKKGTSPYHSIIKPSNLQASKMQIFYLYSILTSGPRRTMNLLYDMLFYIHFANINTIIKKC
jgi:hypothetical protein